MGSQSRRRRVVSSEEESDEEPLAISKPAGRSAKAKANKAWQALVPGRKKPAASQQTPQQDSLDALASGDDEVLIKRTKGCQSRDGRAPDMNVHTSDDEEDLRELTAKQARQSGRKGQSQAVISDPASQDEDAESDSSAEESKSEKEEEDEAEGSEHSGLEELEGNPRALEKTLQDEAVEWADQENDELDGSVDPSRLKRPTKQSRTPGRGSGQKSDSAPPSGSKRSRSDGDEGSEPEVHMPPRKKATFTDDTGRGSRKLTSDKGHRTDDKVSKPKTVNSKNVAAKTNSGTQGLNQDKTAKSKASHSNASGAKMSSERSRKSGHGLNERTKRSASDKNERSQVHGGKRKREKVNEVVKWASDQEAEGTDKTSPVKRPRGSQSKGKSTKSGQSDDSDVVVSGSDGEDSGIEIVPPTSSQHLKLTEQHGRVAALLHCASKELVADILIHNAFPDGPMTAVDFARRALIRCAKDLDDKELHKRLKSDDRYWPKLASYIQQRISNTRGAVKKITDSQPPTAFNIQPGDAGTVDWLLDKRRFIYPVNTEKRTCDDTQPYGSPLFAAILRPAYFTGPHSLGNSIADRFSSSLPEEPDEKEIPAPMLALAATALQASLTDYKNVVYTSSRFEGNTHIVNYRANIAELSELKARKPRWYHRMMHGLYKDLTRTCVARTTAVNHVSLTNYDAIPDE